VGAAWEVEFVFAFCVQVSCVCLGRGCRHVRDKQLQQRGQGGYQIRLRGESGCSLGGCVSMCAFCVQVLCVCLGRGC